MLSEYRKILEFNFDYYLNTREEEDKIKIFDKGKFNCFSQLISYKYVLVAALPLIDASQLVNLSSEHLPLDIYIVDIEFIENNADLYEKIDEKKYSKNDEVVSEIIKVFLEQLRKAYHKAVFQACCKELSVNPQDVSEIISISHLTPISINLSETFHLIKGLHHNADTFNFWLKRERTSLKKKTIKKIHEENEVIEEKEKERTSIMHTSPITPLLRALKATIWEQIASVENMKFPNEEFLNRNFEKIVELFFKKIENTKFYSPNLNSLESTIEKSRKGDERYCLEYLNSVNKKIQALRDKDDVHFLSLKVDYLTQNGGKNNAIFKSFFKNVLNTKISFIFC